MHLLELPSEIKLQIYDLLLANPTLTVQYLFVRQNFQSAYRCKSAASLYPQLLRTCRQIHDEAAHVLYGSPHFNCASSIHGVERLCAQIGNQNFSFIKHVTVDSVDFRNIAATLKGGTADRLYRSLESAKLEGYRIVDLKKSRWLLDIDLNDVLDLCTSAQDLINHHPNFGCLGQISTASEGGSSWADARDDTPKRVQWRLVKSAKDLTSEETVLDLEEVHDMCTWLMQKWMKDNLTRPTSRDIHLPKLRSEGMHSHLRDLLYPRKWIIAERTTGVEFRS